jgi:hypothetical protein
VTFQIREGLERFVSWHDRPIARYSTDLEPSMRSQVLTVTVLLLLIPIANVSARTRTKCCHGCKGYFCNHKNCGDKCKMGPDCRGCWKGC